MSIVYMYIFLQILLNKLLSKQEPPGDQLVSEKIHDPDKISECPMSACSEELIESPPPC